MKWSQAAFIFGPEILTLAVLQSFVQLHGCKVFHLKVQNKEKLDLHWCAIKMSQKFFKKMFELF